MADRPIIVNGREDSTIKVQLPRGSKPKVSPRMVQINPTDPDRPFETVVLQIGTGKPRTFRVKESKWSLIIE